VTKHRRYNDQPLPAMYILNRQLPNWATPQIVIRTTAGAGPMLPAIRKAIEMQNPQAAIVTIETMADMMRRTVADEVYRARLSLVFGATALLLAAIGLYGLVARSVSEDRREIGVRVALGAQRGAVVSFVLRHAVAPVAAGLVAGVAASLAASGFVSTMLHGVTAASPQIFVIVVSLLSGAALMASLVPAHRASRIDPIVALRSE
jgi:ABC-type antimicrobial peptide transport system permease subunit